MLGQTETAQGYRISYPLSQNETKKAHWIIGIYHWRSNALRKTDKSLADNKKTKKANNRDKTLIFYLDSSLEAKKDNSIIIWLQWII